MIVCHCNGTTDREIRRAVRNGAGTLREVSRACGAAAGCGGCSEMVRELITLELGAREARASDPEPTRALA